MSGNVPHFNQARNRHCGFSGTFTVLDSLPRSIHSRDTIVLLATVLVTAVDVPDLQIQSLS
jgi:hypothetical protein